MSKKKVATPLAVADAAPSHYGALLSEIKLRIRHAQARAWMAVNAEMVRLYWCIGQVIANRQRQEGYGTAVIPRLARDLHNELPEEKGFSERNIKRMLAFYRLYPEAVLDTELVPQPVAQLAGTPDSDDRLRHADDKPTIGLILCQQHNRVLAEYTLRSMENPIGVASYELTRALPAEMKTSLPSIEQIERELAGSDRSTEEDAQ